MSVFKYHAFIYFLRPPPWITEHFYSTLWKKPCPYAPNSDVDNGGAEPNDMGIGIFRPPRRLVRATVVHIGISRSFFYSVCWMSSGFVSEGLLQAVLLIGCFVLFWAYLWWDCLTYRKHLQEKKSHVADEFINGNLGKNKMSIFVTCLFTVLLLMDIRDHLL